MSLKAPLAAACTARHWESGIARTARGVPLRVDGIKQLGNSVVPAGAQAIGQAINDAIKEESEGGLWKIA